MPPCFRVIPEVSARDHVAGRCRHPQRQLPPSSGAKPICHDNARLIPVRVAFVRIIEPETVSGALSRIDDPYFGALLVAMRDFLLRDLEVDFRL